MCLFHHLRSVICPKYGLKIAIFTNGQISNTFQCDVGSIGLSKMSTNWRFWVYFTLLMLKFPLDNYPEYKKECMTEEHHSQLLWLPPRAERVEESLALKKPKKNQHEGFYGKNWILFGSIADKKTFGHFGNKNRLFLLKRKVYWS